MALANARWLGCGILRLRFMCAMNVDRQAGLCRKFCCALLADVVTGVPDLGGGAVR